MSVPQERSLRLQQFGAPAGDQLKGAAPCGGAGETGGAGGVGRAGVVIWAGGVVLEENRSGKLMQFAPHKHAAFMWRHTN